MSSKKSILYHTNWANYARNFQVKDIPIQGVTDIAYAFFNIQDSGGGNYVIVSGDAWADFQNPFIGDGVDPQNTWSSPPSDLGLLGQFTKLYKQTNGSFRLQLAIGGWTWSTNFSLAVRTASSRNSFAASIINLFKQWPVFKGVSFDWEYLSNDGVNYGNAGNVADPSDPANFVLLCQTLRNMFQQQGWTDYTIAACFTAAPEKMKFNASSLVPVLDEWHVMTYDFADGAWSNVSAHQSNLMPSPFGPWSASAAAEAYIAAGVPPQNIYIGVPLYSRGFAGTNGIGQPSTGPSPDMSWQAGIVDYKALPLSGAVEMWDSTAKAGYSYDANRKVLNTYDVPQAVLAKCQFVQEKGLGGVIIWESSADAPYNSNRSLLKIIHDTLIANNPPKPGPPLPPSPPIVQPTPPAPIPQPGPPVTPGAAPWDPTKKYNVGDLVSYQGHTYKCLQAHTAQPSWTPTAAVSLWVLVPGT